MIFNFHYFFHAKSRVIYICLMYLLACPVRVVYIVHVFSKMSSLPYIYLYVYAGWNKASEHWMYKSERTKNSDALLATRRYAIFMR